MLKGRNNRGRVRSVSRINEARIKAGLPELGISLKKRRTWWADGDDKDDEGQDGAKYNPKDLDEAKKIIDSLVKRVDERDDEIGTLKSGQESLTERIQAMETAARNRSEQDGDYKKLYEDQLAEVERLKPLVERGKSAIENIRATNEQKIAGIPENLRSAVPLDYAPEKLQTWLNANEGWLSREPAPGYDGGEGGTGDLGNNSKALSSDEKAITSSLGIDAEEFRKIKDELSQEE